MILHTKLTQEIKKIHDQMDAEGQLVSRERLGQYYATFRERFGPQRLKGLGGESLLGTLHDHSNRDSLVYWLEFKDDEEFPAIFGSIAGGSALKFGIYRRKDTGAWMTGSPQNQKELTMDEAIEVAQTHRDQLVRGAMLLDKFPSMGNEADYRLLQEQLDSVAPSISDTAWGHKYFSLLYPEILDDYHVEHYQQFHLMKLLQLPPEGSGRYLAAGRYMAIADELGIPLNHLTSILNRRNGRPYRYWRIGTKLRGVDSRWDLMRSGKFVAVGWADIGDLSEITHDRESKERIRQAIQYQRPSIPQAVGRETKQLFDFVAAIGEGDYVLPSDGAIVLGVGKVVADYSYSEGSDIPHRRPVKWLSLEEWRFPTVEIQRRTVYSLKNHLNLVEIERRVLNAPPIPKTATLPPVGDKPAPVRLSGILGRIQSVLVRKRQMVLYGPPGTGKTHWAGIAARDLAAYARFGLSFEKLTESQKEQILVGDGTVGALVRTCTFHPTYGYEDFLEGYRPVTVNENLVFERQDGIFKRLCNDARAHPQYEFYLIIDEINRGDIPRIFGELLTALENNKRGQTIILPISGELFSVPANVYLIGTMNTADRSIALLDTALRRRFGFVELMPDSSVLADAVVANSIPLGPWLDALNSRILESIGRDARNLQIGHAYLLENNRPVTDVTRFARIIQDDVVPLLEEYCYEDYTALAKILGNRLVDEQQQRVRHELFSPDRRDDLIDALLEPSPELQTAPQMVAAEAEIGESEDVDDDANSDEEMPE